MKDLPLPNHIKLAARYAGLHEAGHFVVSRALGFKTGDIALTIVTSEGGYEGGAETILTVPSVTCEEVMSYLERRVQILFAGALAQSLRRGTGTIDQKMAEECVNSQACKIDYAKARELIHLIRNIRYPQDITDEEMNGHLSIITEELWRKAATCVEFDYELIESIGQRLSSKVKAIGIEARLTAEGLDALPAVVARFNR
jgi:hypothetical protein